MHEWPWEQANLHASKEIILQVFSWATDWTYMAIEKPNPPVLSYKFEGIFNSRVLILVS